MPPPIRRLLALDGGEFRDLVRAQVALLRAEWRLKREPIGALAIRDPFHADHATGDPGRARALARAVERAAAHGIFRPFCLTRAMAIRSLLEADGILGASIRVGVRRHEGEFQAHAWVLWAHEVLGDRADHVARFTEVDDLRVLQRG
jgi:hypothetical protein